MFVSVHFKSISGLCFASQSVSGRNLRSPLRSVVSVPASGHCSKMAASSARVSRATSRIAIDSHSSCASVHVFCSPSVRSTGLRLSAQVKKRNKLELLTGTRTRQWQVESSPSTSTRRRHSTSSPAEDAVRDAASTSTRPAIHSMSNWNSFYAIRRIAQCDKKRPTRFGQVLDENENKNTSRLAVVRPIVESVPQVAGKRRPTTRRRLVWSNAIVYCELMASRNPG